MSLCVCVKYINKTKPLIMIPRELPADVREGLTIAPCVDRFQLGRKNPGFIIAF